LNRLPPNEPRSDGSGVMLSEEYRTDLGHAIGWPIVLAAVLVALVVLAVVRQATVRPADRDHRIDLVLRVRSARVAVGTGIALTGALGVAAAERLNHVAAFLARPYAPVPPGWLAAQSGIAGALSLGLLLTGLLGWVWVANPPWRRPSVPIAA
jgi:hypothetical protein